jgi:hypothetical protein
MIVTAQLERITATDWDFLPGCCFSPSWGFLLSLLLVWCSCSSALLCSCSSSSSFWCSYSSSFLLFLLRLGDAPVSPTTRSARNYLKCSCLGDPHIPQFFESSGKFLIFDICHPISKVTAVIPTFFTLPTTPHQHEDANSNLNLVAILPLGSDLLYSCESTFTRRS